MSGTFRYPAYMDPAQIQPESDEMLEKEVRALLEAMTLEEKMSLCQGHNEGRGVVGNGGYNRGIPRLGIPEIRMYDGPAGVTSVYETTGLPIQEMLAAAWDPDLAYDYGRVMGSENAAISGNTQLGAQYDVLRFPQYVRTRDMLGEDPFLLKALSVPETKGIQDQHTVAVLKHFAMCCQNPDFQDAEDQLVDEQTLHEIYLPAFEAAVTEGGAASVMCAYNKVNGEYASASTYLLKHVLRDLWNFKGYVMCDWGANHALTTHKGMDIEMPCGAYNSPQRLKLALQKGRLTEQDIEDAASHVLYGCGMAGYLSLVEPDADGAVRSEEGRTEPIRLPDRYEEAALKGLFQENAEICLEIARRGAVLLKNEKSALPLTPADYSGEKSVAMLGLGAVHLLSGSGQERSYGVLRRMKAPADEVRRLAGEGAHISAEIALDLFGETIPAEAFYRDEACTVPGIICTYGISKADADAFSMMPSPPDDDAKEDTEERKNVTAVGGAGLEFKGVAAADNDEDSDVAEHYFAPGESIETHMIGHETKSVCCVDETIDFTVGTLDGTVNQTYKNGPDGKAFPEGSAYTWNGYLTVPQDGEYDLIFQAIGGNAQCEVWFDGSPRRIGRTEIREGAHWPWENLVSTPEGMNITGAKVFLKKGCAYRFRIVGKAMCAEKDLQIRLSWITPQQRSADYTRALEAAAKAGKVVLFLTSDYGFQPVGTPPDDGMRKNGRPCMEIPSVQKKLLYDVKNVMKEDAKLIVVMNSGKLFSMEWHEMADAILNVFSPGQEGGTAIAELLTGRVNPGGKMAYTIPEHDSDTLITDTAEHTKKRYLGYTASDGKRYIDHDEGIFTGYRWYDRTHVRPLYTFGHGLSYTTFSYSDPEITGRKVTFTVTNTGDVRGSEIAQVYLGAAQVPDHIQMAVKQLCGFIRIEDLGPGESRRVSVTIPERSLCYWDPHAPLRVQPDGTKGKWVRTKGIRRIMVGGSSDDLPLTVQAAF